MTGESLEAICLPSGRGGCDSQMIAVARGLGLGAAQTPSGSAPSYVCSTGPERAYEAAILASRLGVPSVGFGQPGPAASSLDLVVTTPQFHVPGANVLRLPYAISPHGDCAAGCDGPDAEILAGLPRPLGLLLVGGPAGPWDLDPARVEAALTSMLAEYASVAVLTSARTPSRLKARLCRLVRPNIVVDSHEGVRIRMAAAVLACDAAHVTGDSVSMVSEVAAAGRPVAIIVPPACGIEVEEYLAEARADPVRHAMPGDLRRFWSAFSADGGRPALHDGAAGVLATAVEAVARLLRRNALPQAA